MKQVVVYGTRNCPYCIKARDLLKKRGIRYRNIDVTDPAKRAEMTAKARQTSVPQIFIGDRHVGGHDDLVRLDQRGKLMDLLGGRPAPGVRPKSPGRGSGRGSSAGPHRPSKGRARR